MPNRSEISATAGAAPFAAIRERLRHLLSGSFEPGDLLPSEQKLANRFGVHRHTLRRALAELEREGWVRRQRGKRALVLHPPVRFNVTRRSVIRQAIQEAGSQPDDSMLFKREEPADQEVARELNLRRGTKVLRLEMLSLCDGVPVAVHSHYMLREVWGEVFRDFTGGDVCAHAESRVHIQQERRRSRVCAGPIDPEDAARLLIPDQSIVLQMRCIAWQNDRQRSIEFVHSRFRWDMFELTFD